jgi:hypothetical protein
VVEVEVKEVKIIVQDLVVVQEGLFMVLLMLLEQVEHGILQEYHFLIYQFIVYQ